MKAPFSALTIAAAATLLHRHIQIIPKVQTVPLVQALGHRLAHDILAGDPVPGFNRATRDGFAVKCQDTKSASLDQPVYLTIGGEVWAGQNPRQELSRGQAWRIATGAMLPTGANGVVMQEDVSVTETNMIKITQPVQPDQYVMRIGEEVNAGEKIFSTGHQIRAQDLGLLSAAGITRVEVISPMQVGIISTGDELVEPHCDPGPGQVRDINAYTLQGQVLAAGGRVIYYGIVGDNFNGLYHQLKLALQQCDVVLLSGGSSVGVKDVAAAVLSALGSPGVLFHGLAIKPGRPTIGAVVNGKPILGLPGQPMAAMVVFDLLGVPILQTGGLDDQKLAFPLRVKLKKDVVSAPGREDYLPVYIEEQHHELVAEPVPGKTGLISVLTKANGLAALPAEQSYARVGTYVRAKLF